MDDDDSGKESNRLRHQKRTKRYQEFYMVRERRQPSYDHLVFVLARARAGLPRQSRMEGLSAVVGLLMHCTVYIVYNNVKNSCLGACP